MGVTRMKRVFAFIISITITAALVSGCRDKDISEERGGAQAASKTAKAPSDTPAPPTEFVFKSSGMDVGVLKSAEMESVEKLVIYGTGIGPELQAIVDGKKFKNLKELHISETFAGNTGAVLIANSKTFSGLRALNMAKCDIGDEGVLAIADSKFLKKLRSLNLAHNKITDTGAIALKDSKTLSKLKSLNMKDNWIQPQYGGADALEEMRGRGVDVTY